MTSRVHSVAILAANKAFTSILSDVLQAERGHRVPCFSEAAALTTFLVISPVDVVVLDADAEGGRELAQQLRKHSRLANPFVQIVALTRANPAFHRPLLTAGADLVLQKPVAPARLPPWPRSTRCRNPRWSMTAQTGPPPGSRPRGR